MMQVFQHHTARVPQRYSRCCIGDHTHIPSQGICVSFQRATASCQQDGCLLVETKLAGQTMSWTPSCQQDGLPRRRLHPVDRMDTSGWKSIKQDILFTGSRPVDRMAVADSDFILSTGWMIPSGVHASREVRHGAASVLSTGWPLSNPAPSYQQDEIEAKNYPVDRMYRKLISLLIIPGISSAQKSSCRQDDSSNTVSSDTTEFLVHSVACILSTGWPVSALPSSWQQDDFILGLHPVNRMKQLCPSLILTTGWRCNRPYVHYGWRPHPSDGTPPPRSPLRQHPQTPPRAGFGVSGTSDFEVLP